MLRSWVYTLQLEPNSEYQDQVMNLSDRFSCGPKSSLLANIMHMFCNHGPFRSGALVLTLGVHSACANVCMPCVLARKHAWMDGWMDNGWMHDELCMCAFMFLFVYVCMHACMYAYKTMYISVYTYIYTYTYIYIYIHMSSMSVTIRTLCFVGDLEFNVQGRQ